MPIPSSRSRNQVRSQALVAALAYLAFGIAWILGSDRLIERLSDDAAVLSKLQSAKGLAFIAISATAVYFIVWLYAAHDEPSPPSASHSRPRPRLRFQLVLLAGAITLPLVLLLAYNIDREARRHHQSAEDAALSVAQHVANDTARVLRDTRLAAEVLAQRPEARALDASRCDAQLLQLPSLIPHIANGLTLTSSGDVVCLARSLPGPHPNLRDWSELQPLLRTREPMLGGVSNGRFSSQWVVPLAVAIRDEAGEAIGALVLALDLTRLSTVGAGIPGSSSGFIALVDANGRLLMREPPLDRLGGDVSDSALTRAALEGGQGSGRARNHEGIDTIFGYTRVRGAEWTAIAGIPAKAALGASRESAARLSMLGLLLVLTTAIVAYGIGRGIERPMRAIALALRRYAEGDLKARAPISGARETSEVAARVNELLDRLPELEAQLRASEHRLHMVLGAAQEGVVFYSPEERVIFINETAARLLGHEQHAALIGRSLGEILPVEFQPGAAQRFAERRLGKADRYEARIRAADGSERWLFVSATPLITEGGAFEGVLAMMYDITERKEVEERLARVTRLYWALSKVNESVVRTTDRNTLFSETCSIVVQEGGFVSAFVALLDRSQAMLLPAAASGAVAGVIGREPVSIESDGKYAGGPLAIAVRTGQPQVVNDFVADSRTEPARDIAAQLGIRSCGAFPLRCEGVTVGALAVYAPDVGYFDIGLTELMHQIADDVSFALDVYARAAARNRAEAEVRELAAELERRVAERTARLTEANRELEAFSYSVSHDLRAPVRAINGFAQILAGHAQATLDDEGKRLLANIIRSSTHMGRLIDDLLAFAQLGRRAVELRPVRMAAVLDRVLDELRPVVDARGARISVTGSELQIQGEPTLLHQVFLNLLANALEYRNGDRRLEIHVECRELTDRCEVSVQDNGIGIAPEDHQRIFDMFVRLHSGTAHPGTGIGLALAAKAAALMHGEIRVDSVLGDGATFHVLLEKARATSSAIAEKAL